RIARAQAYPSRPVHIIVGFPGGGASDTTARLIGQSLSERLGQPFVIENRPGAASNLAAEAVVRAPPDGYTLLLVTSVNAINANLGFDFIRDIVPVARLVQGPGVMEVNPAAPMNTPPDIVEKLNKEINAVLADPTMEARIENFGYTAFASSSTGFGKFIAEDIEKWAKVVKFAGIKPE